MCALKALEEQGASRPRCVVLIEASEESGSIHLPPYITLLQAEIGVPDLVVCLDSGAGNYEQLWMTTSLRGVVNATVKATVLEQAMHSGSASGVVPSSFRVLRQILERIEDSATGAVRLPELHTQIPPSRLEEAKLCAQVLGETIHSEFPFAQGVKPMSTDLVELLSTRPGVRLSLSSVRTAFPRQRPRATSCAPTRLLRCLSAFPRWWTRRLPRLPCTRRCRRTRRTTRGWKHRC